MIERAITANISDAKTSIDHTHILATYSFGSCIGVCLYNRAKRTGDILHYLLPDSPANTQKTKEKPFPHAHTGMKSLFEKIISLGTKKNQMRVKLKEKRKN